MMVVLAVRLMLVELGLVLYMKVHVGFGLGTGMKVTGSSSLMSGGFLYKDFFALMFC